VLPTGLLGLMLTAMVAALASTIDSHLNWGASYWTNDLYDRVYCRGIRGRVPSDRSLVWVARVSSTAILVIALAIVPTLSSIQVAWHTSLLLGAGVGVILVLRWLWWRITAWSEIAALAVSTILAPVLLGWLPPDQEAARLLWIAVGATGAGVVVALVGPPESMAGLERFYRRVQPPGFWQPVADACGLDPKFGVWRLLEGLAATALAAWTMFAALTGLGSMLIGSPAPAWLAHRGLWLAALLVSSVAVIPFWIRLGASARMVESPHRMGRDRARTDEADDEALDGPHT